MPCVQVTTSPATYQAGNPCPSTGQFSSGPFVTEAQCREACKEGACCESNGTCNVRPQCQCQGASQTFRGVGTVCSPNPCVPCKLCYANFTSITASKAVGTIGVNGGNVSVTVTGGAIVPRLQGEFTPPVQYRSGFSGPAYQWPCQSVPLSANHVALKEESEGSTYQIALSATTNRIVMPIISLGAFFRIGNNPPLVSKTVTWQFSSAVKIISQGLHFEYGQCENPGNCLQAAGNTLTGLEGSGIVDFAGSFSELSLTVASASENFNAFGIGIPCDTNPLP